MRSLKRSSLPLKSPKTLSNLFAIYNQKSPQQIILERLALGAKSLMSFTDKQNQEIAYELGFNNPAHFSKFFKKMTGHSPSRYGEIPVLSTQREICTSSRAIATNIVLSFSRIFVV